MPYDIGSPLGTGLGAAASYMQGQTQKKQADLDAQTQAAQTALLKAQAQYQLSGADERTAKTNQILQVMQYYPADIQAQIADKLARGDMDGAIAIMDKAHAGYYNAQSKEILTGKIPEEIAHGKYYASLPAYNASKLQEMYASMDSRAQTAANQIAARIQIAGANNDTRMALGYLTYQRIQQGISEQEAFREALAQYTFEAKNYTDAQSAQYKGTGNPPAGLPNTPSFQGLTIQAGGGQNGMSPADVMAMVQYYSDKSKSDLGGKPAAAVPAAAKAAPTPSAPPDDKTKRALDPLIQAVEAGQMKPNEAIAELTSSAYFKSLPPAKKAATLAAAQRILYRNTSFGSQAPVLQGTNTPPMPHAMQ